MENEKEFVRLMSCVFCGKETGIALDQRMGRTKAFNDPKCLTPKGTVPDFDGCKECKERFKTYKYFVGDCGHEGFIKREALEKMLKGGKKFLEEMDKKKQGVFRMEKCPMCMGMIKEKDCLKI